MGSIFDPPDVPDYRPPPPAPPPPPPPPPPSVPEPEPPPDPEPPPAPPPEPEPDDTAADEAEEQRRQAEERAARGWTSTVNTSFRGVLDPLPSSGPYGTKTLLGD